MIDAITDPFRLYRGSDISNLSLIDLFGWENEHVTNEFEHKEIVFFCLCQRSSCMFIYFNPFSAIGKLLKSVSLPERKFKSSPKPVCLLFVWIFMTFRTTLNNKRIWWAVVVTIFQSEGFFRIYYVISLNNTIPDKTIFVGLSRRRAYIVGPGLSS